MINFKINLYSIFSNTSNEWYLIVIFNSVFFYFNKVCSLVVHLGVKYIGTVTLIYINKFNNLKFFL